MKCIRSLIFIFSMCSVFIVEAQVSTDVPKDIEYYQKYRTPINPSYFYFELNYLNPVGTTGQAPSSELPILAPFIGEDGMGFKSGFGLGFGAILNLDGKTSHKNKAYPFMSFGMDYTDYGYPIWSNVISEAYSEFVVYGIGGDLGFGVAFNRSDQIVIELSYAVGINFLENPDIYSNSSFIGIDFEPTIYDFSILPNYDAEDYSSVVPRISFSCAMRSRRIRLTGSYIISRVNSPYIFTYYEPRITGTRLDERKYQFDSNFLMNYFKISLALVL